MDSTALLLCAVACASGVHLINPLPQPGYLAPEATGYIWRQDNNGPASLITLGAPNYQQPHAFAAPLPIAHQPLALEHQPVYELAPAPLPYIAAKPIVEEDSDEYSEESDEDGDDGGNDGIADDGHGYEKGEGSDYSEENHAAHGEKGSKGYHSKDHHAKGESGHYAKDHKEGHSSEAEGEKGSHHDVAEAHGKHHQKGSNYKGGDHGHKKYASKGEEVTGYHKVFNKDEFKKDHDFYDVADKSGHFNKHGYEKGHHASEKGAHKKGGHKDAGYEKDGFGKAGSHAKGHYDEKHKAHSAEESDDSHYHHEEDHGKKGGSDNEKEFAYAEEDYDDEE